MSHFFFVGFIVIVAAFATYWTGAGDPPVGVEPNLPLALNLLAWGGVAMITLFLFGGMLLAFIPR